MSDAPTPDHKVIASRVAAAFGGDRSTAAYGDPTGTSTLEVLSAVGRPEQGLTSFCTIGLSDTPVPGHANPPLGVEIIGVSTVGGFADVVAAAGFLVVHGGGPAEAGVVLPGVVSEHLEDVTTPHLMLVAPLFWEGLDSLVLSRKTVTWLMALPVTDAERAYRDRHGADALEELFGNTDPDIIDLWRPSVV